MTAYFNFPLTEEYTFIGKFADSSTPDRPYAGMIKYRPGYLTRIQIATDVKMLKASMILHGQVFQDNQLPQLCTLIHPITHTSFPGLSNSGFKIAPYYRYVILGNCIQHKDVIKSYNYSNKIIQCFFAPQGSKYENYSPNTLDFQYKDCIIKVFQNISINPFAFMLDTEFTLCSDKFKAELRELLKKNENTNYLTQGIKKEHTWAISINKEITLQNIDEYDEIHRSLNNLFFILTGHLSSPLGVKIEMINTNEKQISYDVLLPISTKLQFDKNYDIYSKRFDLYNAITIKTIGEEAFKEVCIQWDKKENIFHYITQTLISNYTDRHSSHNAYIFTKSIDALEAIAELDRENYKRQSSKIKYAIDKYGTEETKKFFNDMLNNKNTTSSILAGERGKIVHPKSSHKDIWNDNKKYYNLTIALDAVLHTYVQQKLGVDTNLSYNFQNNFLQNNLSP
jgi:hypothetical protein